MFGLFLRDGQRKYDSDVAEVRGYLLDRVGLGGAVTPGPITPSSSREGYFDCVVTYSNSQGKVEVVLSIPDVSLRDLRRQQRAPLDSRSSIYVQRQSCKSFDSVVAELNNELIRGTPKGQPTNATKKS